MRHLVPVAVLTIASCSASKPPPSSKAESFPLEAKLDHVVTVEGRLEDAKLGAVLMLGGARTVWIDGLASWSPELHGKVVQTTGKGGRALGLAGRHVDKVQFDRALQVGRFHREPPPPETTESAAKCPYAVLRMDPERPLPEARRAIAPVDLVLAQVCPECAGGAREEAK